ncbi:thermonuclease family protein [Mesorhizobium sp.]|uniref:thermonuclease family protein n=1 Tax=Mesorhizobium sp. TaxID=1871066 RepID=UPI0025BC1F86|nr:thermonuclease family protein [Mesorhizobium sp.]
MAGAPLRLVLVTVAAVSALVTQFVLHNSGPLPEINLQNIIKPKPVSIAGVAPVIDGDTIEIHGQRVRFNGIDAPESRQYCDDAKGFEYPCGRRSRSAGQIPGSLQAGAMRIRDMGPPRALCRHLHAGGWNRRGRQDRRAGQALDWPKYSNGGYAAQQGKAQAAKLGLWVGNFQTPWDWRAQHSDDVQVPSTPGFVFGNAGCNIKGNISADGERIYHVPGQKYYSVPVISQAKGERWFCSEAEAEAAGWRRSKR